VTARLFIASTPMIALACAGAALAHPGRSRLLLIEDFDLAGRLQDLLEGWRDNPFEAIMRLPGRHTEHVMGARDGGSGVRHFLHRLRVKRALRRQTLTEIEKIDASLRPDEVWLGNDRKPETQLALHRASQRARQPVGRYLDDGLYSYLGDVRQRPLVRRIDAFVKRLGYGRWWQRADHAGTTSWIREAWLVFIDEETPYPPHLRRALPRHWYDGRPICRLGLQAARAFGLDRRALSKVGLVLVLPHSNQLRANHGLLQRLRDRVRDECGRGRQVAVKYHPREIDPDPAGLLRDGTVRALPTLLPLELILPLLPPGVALLGEGSTALLAARWLRPDLAVADLGFSQDGYAARARELFARHGIHRE
jgi:hypothetical protein